MMRKFFLGLTWLFLLFCLAAFALFAFNGLVIPLWYNRTMQESIFQTQHAGYFVGAIVMMLIFAIGMWICWRIIKKLNALGLNHAAT
jgi:hypothetical protein